MCGLMSWWWIVCLQGVQAFPSEEIVHIDNLLTILSLGIVIVVLASQAKRKRISHIKHLEDFHKEIEDLVESLLKDDTTPKGKTSIVINGHFGGKEIAVRIVPKKHIQRGNREVEMLKLTKDHVHTMPLLFNIEISGRFCILMPNYKLSLEKFLDDNGLKRKNSLLNQIVYEIAKGLSALHDSNIIHGNLRPSCIFLEFVGGKCRATISNFSCSQVGQTSSSIFGMSQYWSAPEVLKPKPELSQKSDTYSFGLIAFSVWISNVYEKNRSIYIKPFEAKNLSDQLRRGNYRASRLLIKLLKNDPIQRMKVKDVMKDPVFWTKGRLPFFLECLKYCSERTPIALDNTKMWKHKFDRSILGGAYGEGQPEFVRFIRNTKVHPRQDPPSFGDRHKLEEWIIQTSLEDFALNIVDAALPQVDNELIDEFFGPQADL